MKCAVCGCTDDHACLGGCYWIADNLCSNCGIIISKTYTEELIELLKTPGINSKQKAMDELEHLFSENNEDLHHEI
jgi:hypothetical protein